MAKSTIIYFVLAGILGLLVGNLYLLKFPSASTSKSLPLEFSSPDGLSPVTIDPYITVIGGGGGGGGIPEVTIIRSHNHHREFYPVK